MDGGRELRLFLYGHGGIVGIEHGDIVYVRSLTGLPFPIRASVSAFFTIAS